MAIEAFPFDPAVRVRYRSTWHAPRDAGARQHEGVDMFASEGTPIRAVASGRVLPSRSLDEETERTGFGVVVRSDDGTRVLYAHLQGPSGLRPGDRVEAGEPLGSAKLGRTGNARNTAPHLHLGVYDADGTPRDPAPMLDRVRTERSHDATPAPRSETLASQATRSGAGGLGVAIVVIGLLWASSRRRGR